MILIFLVIVLGFHTYHPFNIWHPRYTQIVIIIVVVAQPQLPLAPSPSDQQSPLLRDHRRMSQSTADLPEPGRQLLRHLQQRRNPRARDTLRQPQLRVRIVPPNKLLPTTGNSRTEVPPTRNLHDLELLQYFNLLKPHRVIGQAQLPLRIPTATVYVTARVQHQRVPGPTAYRHNLGRFQVRIVDGHHLRLEHLFGLVAETQLAVAVCTLRMQQRKVREIGRKFGRAGRMRLTQAYSVIILLSIPLGI